MQLSILKFFQSIENPTLNLIGQAVTFMGEQTVFIIITVFILWCYDKRRGFAIFSSLFIALVSTNLLKAIIRYPRPFVVDPSLGSQRLQTATGYSFPSGHSTGAASYYSGLSIMMGKRWISIVGAFLILFVGLSRLYLRVHWPLDVFAGWMVGFTVSFTLMKALLRLWDNKELLKRLSIAVGITSLVVSLLLAFLISGALADEIAFSDLMKLLALAGGGYLGFAYEQKKINYDEGGVLGVKVVRFFIGLAGIFIIQGSKALLPAHLLFSVLRYMLTGLWATALYPLIGTKIRLGSKYVLFDSKSEYSLTF